MSGIGDIFLENIGNGKTPFNSPLTRAQADLLYAPKGSAASPMTGPLEIQNGAAQQYARIYGTYDSGGADYRRATLTMTTAGNMQLRAEGLGTGVAGNTFDLYLNGTSYLQLTAAGTATFVGGLQIGQQSTFQFAGWTRIKSAADGVLTFTNQLVNNFGRIQLGGTTSAFPSLKRQGAGIDVRLADDSGYALIRGKIQTDNAYSAGTVVPTGTLVIYDSTGTAYRIPCLV